MPIKEFHRRDLFKATAAAGLAVTAAAVPGVALAHDKDDDDDERYGHESGRGGKVYTSTNGAAGNEVLVFDDRASAGLQLRQRIATGGSGTGAGLGSQGAVTLSEDGRFLFVVNAGSHSLSTFRLGRRGLRLISVVSSGGLAPTSVAEAGGLVFALNTAGAGGVAGFANLRGRLLPVANSARGLSASGGTAPAQVGFTDDGDTLLVTERATNLLTTYRVMDDGSLGVPQPNASAGMTPFGFAVDKRGTLLVSEAFGGAANASALSSYRFADATPQTPTAISASVGTQQTAACWVAVTPDGRNAYTTNAGSGSVSQYRIARDGSVALVEPAAAMVAGSAPIDASVSANGRRLHVLNGGVLTIASYRIAGDGSLTAVGGASGLPAGTVGLAAN
jgi:6-phosphogluconolactonase (cycloisomerase 2 family)